MEVVISTVDLHYLVNQLKPIKQLTTRGYHFVVYTLVAYEKKLKIIASDKSSLSASVEVFAKVKVPGTVSINGTDFYSSVMKIAPDTESKTRLTKSKSINLKSTDTKLELSTSTQYKDKDITVDQTREFQLVASHLSVNELEKPSQINLSMRAEHFLPMLNLANRLVSSYTADITSLSGILLKLKNKELFMVVSDGTRILELKYPEPLAVEDFSFLIPRPTAALINNMMSDGDTISIFADSRKIKFYIDNDGLTTYLASSLLRGMFPEYTPIFKCSRDNGFCVDTKVLLDNVVNIRPSVDDDTYRIRLLYDGSGTISVVSQKTSSHIGFSNSGIKVRGLGENEIKILINALLLEGLLSLMPSDMITVIVPPNDKPIIIEGNFKNIQIRAAMALAAE